MRELTRAPARPLKLPTPPLVPLHAAMHPCIHAAATQKQSKGKEINVENCMIISYPRDAIYSAAHTSHDHGPPLRPAASLAPRRPDLPRLPEPDLQNDLHTSNERSAREHPAPGLGPAESSPHRLPFSLVQRPELQVAHGRRQECQRGQVSRARPAPAALAQHNLADV